MVVAGDKGSRRFCNLSLGNLSLGQVVYIALQNVSFFFLLHSNYHHMLPQSINCMADTKVTLTTNTPHYCYTMLYRYFAN